MQGRFSNGRARMAGAMLTWLAMLASFSAGAHKPSDSYLTITPSGRTIEVRWDVALRDLDAELKLGIDDNGELTMGKLLDRQRDIEAFLMPHFIVRADGAACTADPAAGPTRITIDSHSDGAYAVLQFSLSCALSFVSSPRSLELQYSLFATTDPSHRAILRLVLPGGEAERTSVLDPAAPPRSYAIAPAGTVDTLREFMAEGIWHIWTGFDHILFLLALLLTSVLVPLAGPTHPAGQRGAWQGAPSLAPAALDMFRIVTAFTLAHSITLALAVFDLVSLPSRLVESVIAFTVLVAALNNLWPVLVGRRWIATFFFGLVHGFGFAGALKDLGLPANALGTSLFGFNAGVEIGQLAIVGVFFPLAYALRNRPMYQRGVLTGGSVAIALVALLWFIERAFDLKLISI